MKGPDNQREDRPGQRGSSHLDSTSLLGSSASLATPATQREVRHTTQTGHTRTGKILNLSTHKRHSTYIKGQKVNSNTMGWVLRTKVNQRPNECAEGKI